ncbi:NlpC/P60 family protein [Arthrobacter agilis]|uniref:C40 family peptidase n=1 Tax=Arthrobacter agilis TaxID=37921 RepID=UPI002366D149|nr:C40 family peptidase [Arthrobacter agilis]WDF33766.1 NlpC/P60 family protein [Arthrobacter agilis]
MTITDAVGRVQQIQSTLTMLAAPARAQQTATGTAGSGTTAMSTGTAAAAEASRTAGSPAASPADLFADALAEVVPAPADVAAPAPAAPVAGAAPLPAPASGDAARLIEAARSYEGVPYVWGGTDPATGLDCSGFVQRAYADIGIQLPRVTWDQMNAGVQVPSLAEAQPGDLLFSHDGGHVSMYLGGGKAIDAPQPGQTVAVRDMWETDANITTIRRVLPDAPVGAASVLPPETAAAAPAADDAYAAQAAFLASMAR